MSERTNSIYTNTKLREWIENEIQDAKNPDPLEIERKVIEEERRKKRRQLEKSIGF